MAIVAAWPIVLRSISKLTGTQTHDCAEVDLISNFQVHHTLINRVRDRDLILHIYLCNTHAQMGKFSLVCL